MLAVCLMKKKEILLIDSQSFDKLPRQLRVEFETERKNLHAQYERLIKEFLEEKGCGKFSFSVPNVSCYEENYLKKKT
jgi:hypothetical protein